MRSTKHGLQIAGNLNDLYTENVKILRQEFEKMKDSSLRAFELYDARLKATEDMLATNNSLVCAMGDALQVEVNAVSIQEEQEVTDFMDCDHISLQFTAFELLKTLQRVPLWYPLL